MLYISLLGGAKIHPLFSEHSPLMHNCHIRHSFCSRNAQQALVLLSRQWFLFTITVDRPLRQIVRQYSLCDISPAKSNCIQSAIKEAPFLLLSVSTRATKNFRPVQESRRLFELSVRWIRLTAADSASWPPKCPSPVNNSSISGGHHLHVMRTVGGLELPFLSP